MPGCNRVAGGAGAGLPRRGSYPPSSLRGANLEAATTLPSPVYPPLQKETSSVKRAFHPSNAATTNRYRARISARSCQSNGGSRSASITAANGIESMLPACARTITP